MISNAAVMLNQQRIFAHRPGGAIFVRANLEKYRTKFEHLQGLHMNIGSRDDMWITRKSLYLSIHFSTLDTTRVAASACADID